MHRFTALHAAVLLALPALAHAQSEQRIEITGSAIRRIDAETPLPVTVITRDEIERSGATSAAEVLDLVSANNGGGYNLNLGIGDAANPGFAGASLRGLGPNGTLILLNGRRLAVYAFQGGAVDLNAIALGAIERVEVLRDGASALYGSDAIGGVINFITRKDYRGGELSAALHVPQHPGGRSQNASATFGVGDLERDRYNGFLTLTWDNTEQLKASQRDFAKTAYLPNAAGGPFDKTSGNTIPASIFVPGVGTVNPGAPNCLPPYSFQTAPGGACRFDYASVVDLVAPQHKAALLGRVTFQLAPDWQLFGEANKTRTVTTFRISPTPASGAITFNGDPVLYPAGGKWTPQAVNPATGQTEPGLISNGSFVPLSGDLTIFWRTLEAGPRTDVSTADQDRFVVGVQGRVGQWDLDGAVLRSSSKASDVYTAGYLYESKLLNSTGTPTDPNYAVGTLNPDINPFGFNDAAGLAAIRSALVLGPTRVSTSVRESIDGKASSEVARLAAGPVNVAVGTEFRRETFDDNPFAVLRGGDVLGGGGNLQPVNASRSVQALFGELDLPVLKGLDALLQARWDHYSDFGSTTNPKLGLRWQPAREWLLRASWGTGFRAPTMPEKYTPQTQTNTGNAYNDPYYEAAVGNCYDANGNPTANFNPAYCNNQFNVLTGGNLALQPEKSKQRSIGFVFEPVADSSVSVDYWRTRVNGQIAVPDYDATLAAFIAPFLEDPDAAYAPSTAKLSAAGAAALRAGAANPAILRDNQGFLGFVIANEANLTFTEVYGFDFGAKSRVPLGEWGRLDLGWDASYIISARVGGVESVAAYAKFGPIQRVRQLFSAGWQLGDWHGQLGYRWQSGYRDQGGANRVSPYENLNLGLDWSGIKNLRLGLQVINAADKKPPYSRQGDYFQVGYDPTYADPRGRTWVLGANWKFQ